MPQILSLDMGWYRIHLEGVTDNVTSALPVLLLRKDGIFVRSTALVLHSLTESQLCNLGQTT